MTQTKKPGRLVEGADYKLREYKEHILFNRIYLVFNYDSSHSSHKYLLDKGIEI